MVQVIGMRFSYYTYLLYDVIGGGRYVQPL